MRGIRRAAMTIGFLVVALLPVAAAVSPDGAQPPEVPMAISQPIGNFAALGSVNGPAIPETGMTLLVGTGLLGLAAIMRRAERR